ncbi:MAG: GIY-YIG nuclease family protein [Cyanobacteria bacterium P01_F01_bin.53]
MTHWFVYLIRTSQNTLYTGITTDVDQRLAEHQQGKQGAKYLRARGPLSVVYQVEVGTRSLASKAEYRIKRLKKAQKEKIVVEKPNCETLLALLNIPGEQNH